MWAVSVVPEHSMSSDQERSCREGQAHGTGYGEALTDYTSKSQSETAPDSAGWNET